MTLRDADDYVHRVGRTARAETTGVAVTLVNRMDSQKLERIEKLIGYEINREPLPAFIAEIHEKHPEGPSSAARSKNKFKRRYPQKGRNSSQGGA